MADLTSSRCTVPVLYQCSNLGGCTVQYGTVRYRHVTKACDLRHISLFAHFNAFLCFICILAHSKTYNMGISMSYNALESVWKPQVSRFWGHIFRCKPSIWVALHMLNHFHFLYISSRWFIWGKVQSCGHCRPQWEPCHSRWHPLLPADHPAARRRRDPEGAHVILSCDGYRTPPPGEVGTVPVQYSTVPVLLRCTDALGVRSATLVYLRYLC